MSSTNKTTYYELSQYVGTDKPTYLSDYNGDMLKIDTGIHDAATDASTAVTTANSAASAAATASTNASAAVTTANTASATALEAKTTAETASTNASAALTAAETAETAAAANTIENLAPAYDSTLTYAVGDLCTFIDAQGSGKLYKCIIAVDSPEAFNINKWDDVTASEVFEHQFGAYPLREAVADGVKTRAELFAELISGIDFNTIPHALIVQVEGSARVIFNLAYIDATKFRCSSVRADIANNTLNVVYDNLDLSNGVYQVSQCLTVDGTVTLKNDLSRNVPNSGTFKYQILV